MKAWCASCRAERSLELVAGKQKGFCSFRLCNRLIPLGRSNGVVGSSNRLPGGVRVKRLRKKLLENPN